MEKLIKRRGRRNVLVLAAAHPKMPWHTNKALPQYLQEMKSTTEQSWKPEGNNQRKTTKGKQPTPISSYFPKVTKFHGWVEFHFDIQASHFGEESLGAGWDIPWPCPCAVCRILGVHLGDIFISHIIVAICFLGFKRMSRNQLSLIAAQQ